uniref:Predicted protein n=1 Tax=Hordeum vulgare subsp. vulgare TaxID=112509 RepID=F2EAK0_HORVV|nr:predicted protein [Hordeum vulgare subsp. vulgare]
MLALVVSQSSVLVSFCICEQTHTCMVCDCVY